MNAGPRASLQSRFPEHVRARALFRDDEGVLVALSGGLDSTVLLHLLLFASGVPRVRIQVAHFDHRMRDGSRDDALWVRGLCRAWRVPCTVGCAEDPLTTEEDARIARYEFLDRARVAAGCDWVTTAHHADDQAETVLFRVLRGTGLRGLRGIPEVVRPSGLVRPLLPFWRAELEGYAAEFGIVPRLDPSNRDIRFARNFIRHELIPRVEESLAPGARAALVRLARTAAGLEEAFDSVLPALVSTLATEDGEGGMVIERDRLLAHEPVMVGEVLRELLRRLGKGLDEAGTRAALEFTSTGASGRILQLPGGITLSREFDRFHLRPPREVGVDRPLLIENPGAGHGAFQVGGRRMTAHWSLGECRAGTWVEGFSSRELVFPLILRGREPGDRVSFPYGTKKLKKVLSESRVPDSERARTPVLAEWGGEVLWVPGITRSCRAPPAGGETLTVAISDADDR
jgi:tRNA(Ile)-lysidine synthase